MKYIKQKTNYLIRNILFEIRFTNHEIAFTKFVFRFPPIPHHLCSSFPILP
jgi:hypothetical protein